MNMRFAFSIKWFYRSIGILTLFILLSGYISFAVTLDESIVQKYKYSQDEQNRFAHIISQLETGLYDDETQLRLLDELKQIVGNRASFSYFAYIFQQDPKWQENHAKQLGEDGVSREGRKWANAFLKDQFGENEIDTLRQYLHAQLLNDNPKIVIAAIDVLKFHLADPSAEEQIKPLMDHHDKTIAVKAALGLGELYSNPSIPYLKEILKTHKGYEAYEAALYLSRMNADYDKTTVRNQVKSMGLYSDTAIDVLSIHPDPEDLQVLIEMLAKNSKPNHYDNVLNAITANLQHYSPDEKHKIFGIIQERQDFINQSTSLKTGMFQLLGKIDLPQTLDFIATYLNEQNSLETIQLALIQLGIQKSKKHLNRIIPFLEHDNKNIRAHAIIAIERILAPEGQVPTVNEIKEAHPDLQALIDQRKEWWKKNQDQYSG